MSFAQMSALELRAGYVSGAFSPVEVVTELAERIEQLEPDLNAFVTLTLDAALADASAAEGEYARGGSSRPLLGLPFAAKDLFDTAGIRTTYGSAMFSQHVPTSDAHAVARARRAGAILVGKSATHEFGWGITCSNPHFGDTRNPWAADRIPGGSSGGSAAALAAGLVPLALGTDTGGSVRIPAGFCGVVGVKPTYGRLGTRGQFPLAPSFDHAGVMARTPADAALVLDALGEQTLAADEPARLTVAVCPDLHRVPLAEDVESALAGTVDALRGLGADVAELPLREAPGAYDTFAAIQLAEALYVHRSLGLFPRRREEYGADIRARLELAADVGLGAYRAALDRRRRLEKDFERLFRQADLLLTPTAATTAPPVGSDPVRHLGRPVALRELVMTYTTPQNLLGLPACALRAGFGDDGLPIGMQLTGPRGADARVLQIADRLFEATAEIQDREPDFAPDDTIALPPPTGGTS
jgi:aspartyl-tRNA(Asn)/glutamyl-tRNA(Gln) amidotransferase subunit A